MVEAYGLTVEFQRALAWFSATNPWFWGAVGKELAVEKLTEDAPKKVLLAVREIVKETGRAPTTSAHVAQRMRLWVDAGRMTLEEQELLGEFLEAWGAHAERVGMHAVVAEVKPYIVRDLRMAGAKEIIVGTGKQASTLSGGIDLLRRAETLGVAEDTPPTGLEDEMFAEIEEASRGFRLPTGIAELDVALRGGTMPGSLSVFGAGTKAGKSMFLNTVACEALKLGHFVLWITLENPEWLVKARLVAGLCGLPIDLVTEDPKGQAVQKAWAEARKSVGLFRVKYMPQKVTRWPDVEAVVEQVERETSQRVGLLVLDYVDVMGSSNPAHDGDEYKAQGQASVDMRTWLVQRNRTTPVWGWTASQSKRADKRSPTARVEGGDLADSQGKARALDLLVTGTRKDDTVELFIALARVVEGGQVIGPYPHDFACGRYVVR